MNSLVLLLGVFAYSNAFDIAKSLNADSSHIALGPLDASINIGQLPLKYFPLSPNDEIASINAAKLAKSIRPLFHTGIESMPPLDPYERQTIGPLRVINFLDLVGVTVTAKNLAMIGAQQFHLQNIQIRLENPDQYRVDLTLSVPLIKINTDFTVDVRVPFLKLPPIKGNVKLILNELTTIAAVGGKQPPAHIHLDALHAFGLVSNIQLKLSLNNPTLNFWVNTTLKLLKSTIPFIYNLVKPLINRIVFNLLGKAVILPQVNDILSPITYEQAVAFLLYA